MCVCGSGGGGGVTGLSVAEYFFECFLYLLIDLRPSCSRNGEKHRLKRLAKVWVFYETGPWHTFPVSSNKTVFLKV